MKRHSFVIAPVLFILICINKGVIDNHAYSLPVCISYINSTPPPDSIQSFISIYLQSKKVKVINWSQAMKLFQESAKIEMMSLINSGNLNERTAKSFGDKVNPVSNVLAIQIFQNHSTDTLNYYIDSIRWQTSFIPAKDTFSVKKMTFIPDSKLERNPFVVLKAFLENVLFSKNLR